MTYQFSVHSKYFTSSLVSGMGNREKHIPLTNDYIFPTGSIAKCITAVGIMRLWEEGRIGLNDTIDMHVNKILMA